MKYVYSVPADIRALDARVSSLETEMDRCANYLGWITQRQEEQREALCTKADAASVAWSIDDRFSIMQDTLNRILGICEAKVYKKISEEQFDEMLVELLAYGKT